MRFLFSFLVGFLLLNLLTIPAISQSPETECTPINLLPLGDSTTQGTVGFVGYRYPLWQMFQERGIAVDFVGSQTNYYGNQPETMLSYDVDHESYWGWTVDEVLYGRGSANARIPLSDHLQEYTPDITLLHLGTNDVFRNQPHEETYAELAEMLTVLRTDNPDMTILLAQIIPIATDSAVADFNAGLIPFAEEQEVILVDMNSDYDFRVDNYDSYHPSDSGAMKMAERWFEALLPTLDASCVDDPTAVGAVRFSADSPPPILVWMVILLGTTLFFSTISHWVETQR